IVLGIARAMGEGAARAFPHADMRAYLQAGWRELYESRRAGLDDTDFESFWNSVLSAGVWGENAERPVPQVDSVAMRDALNYEAPLYEGAAGEYEFILHPYLTVGFHDGRGANLPWQQELPDPLTSVVYGSWVELNPATAERLGLREGDVVEVTSPAGTVRAPVYVYPAIMPEVVAMPIGQGHRTFGRYASNRGANPLAIVDVATDRDSGALAWGATMVSLEPTGERVKLIRTSGTPRELGRSILGPYGEGGKPDPHAKDENHG
ncbi:MAG: hypothetical protein KJO54_04595, partial [Gammaproteobacteria bacterium]|nr:hypothetical protein [Gammaproteobacteria bacterium]